MEKERYSLGFSVELDDNEQAPTVSLLMHCAFTTRTLRSWEVSRGEMFMFLEKPNQLVDFLAEKLAS